MDPLLKKALATILREQHDMHHKLMCIKYPDSYGDQWYDDSKDYLLKLAIELNGNEDLELGLQEDGPSVSDV